MLENKNLIIALSVLLFVILAVLMFFEVKNPEGGTAFVESVKSMVFRAMPLAR